MILVRLTHLRPPSKRFNFLRLGSPHVTLPQDNSLIYPRTHGPQSLQPCLLLREVFPLRPLSAPPCLKISMWSPLSAIALLFCEIPILALPLHLTVLISAKTLIPHNNRWSVSHTTRPLPRRVSTHFFHLLEYSVRLILFLALVLVLALDILARRNAHNQSQIYPRFSDGYKTAAFSSGSTRRDSARSGPSSAS